MSKKSELTVREEARQRGVSHGTVFNERKAKKLIDQVGEDFHVVYAWRWSGDDRYAKIGVSTMSKLETRLVATYHPTDDPILLGVMKCLSRGEAEDNEHYFLNEKLERVRPDREWVIIDEEFNEILNEAFYLP